MVDSSLSFGIDDDGKIDRALAALGVVKEEIPERSKGEILELIQGLARQASAKALALPAYGKKHTGLRARVAAGVLAVPTGTGAMVITQMDRSDEAIIPRGMDSKASGTPGGWRHPLFGKPPNYRNDASRSWFLRTMYSGEDGGAAKLSAMLDEAAQEVADA